MVKFKEFLVGDLFTEFIVGNQPVHSNRFDNKEDGMFPVITGVTLNNGVGFYSYRENAKLYKNILTISKDGEYAGTLFLQKQDVILGGHSLGLYNEDVSSESLLYIMGCLNKYQREGFWRQGGVMGSVTLKLIKELPISLPVTTEGTPDYAYMEDYIKGIQRQYIDNLLETNEAERNRLLSIVGLSLDEYERVKGNIELGDAKSYGEFKVGDLFDIEPTKYYKDLRDEEIKNKDGSTPFITTQNTNNGIAGYSVLDAINKGNTITASDTTSDDAIFYQEKDFIGRSHVQNIMPKKGVPFNKNIAMYIITCMRKSASGLYDYGNKFNRDNMKKTSILLPITSTGEVDYQYMEDYISKIKMIYIYIIESYLLTNK